MADRRRAVARVRRYLVETMVFDFSRAQVAPVYNIADLMRL